MNEPIDVLKVATDRLHYTRKALRDAGELKTRFDENKAVPIALADWHSAIFDENSAMQFAAYLIDPSYELLECDRQTYQCLP